MLSATDTFRTIEISTLRLKLRDGLRFIPQNLGGSHCVVVEDELTGRCFRIGVNEYSLIKRLDGRRTVGQAMAASAIETDEPLTEDESVRVCGWLVDNELATSPTSARTSRLRERQARKARMMLPSLLNPISIRVPLFDPDPFLRPLQSFARVCFGPLGACAWAVLITVACLVVVTSWRELSAERPDLASPTLWPLIIAAGVVLKVVHEVAHALACRAIGGRPRQAGVLFLLLFPLPYVDVSSAWACPSRWKRVLVSAAGMLSEIALASLALLVWSFSHDPVVREAMLSIIFAATVVTLLFNANPLMKFDGYYMLADAIDIPNLAQRGQSVLRGLCGRILLGFPYSLAAERRWLTLLTYGLLAAVWRVIVWTSLLLAASYMFQGAGVALAGVALVLWLGPSLWKTVVRMVRPKASQRRVPRLRVAGLVVLVLGLIYGVYTGIHRPSTMTVHGVILAGEPVSVRPPAPGFINQVLVSDGQSVEAGDLIAVLENVQLEEEAKRLELAWVRSELAAREYHRAGEIALWQAEKARGNSLRKQHAETSQSIKELTVHASTGGTILWPNSEATQGRYHTSGAELCRIEPNDNRELVVLVPQQISEELNSAHDWRCRVNGIRQTWTITQNAVPDPSTTRRLPHPALAATAGGPLAVRSTHGSNSTHSVGDNIELATPHLRVRVALPSDTNALGLIPSGTLTTIHASSSRPVIADAQKFIGFR